MDWQMTMDLARYNNFWILSFIAAPVIMLLAAVSQKKWVLIFGVFVSLAATYCLCVQAVDTKWADRLKIARQAHDPKAMEAVSHGDTGNKSMTVTIFAPLEAVIYTAFWGLLGWHVIGPGRWRIKEMNSRIKYMNKEISKIRQQNA